MNCERHKDKDQSEECVHCLQEQIKNMRDNLRKALPKSIWMATLIVIDNMDTTLYNHLATIRKEDLISLHHDLGQQIRNCLFLWDKDVSSELYANEAISDPDELSMKIIESIWEKIHVDVSIEKGDSDEFEYQRSN